MVLEDVAAYRNPTMIVSILPNIFLSNQTVRLRGDKRTKRRTLGSKTNNLHTRRIHLASSRKIILVDLG